MAKRRLICDVPGCGASRLHRHRLCERCFRKLPGEIRVGIAEAKHQHRERHWRALRRRAAEFLNLGQPNADLPAGRAPRIPMARVIELQRRLLGERDDP